MARLRVQVVPGGIDRNGWPVLAFQDNRGRGCVVGGNVCALVRLCVSVRYAPAEPTQQ